MHRFIRMDFQKTCSGRHGAGCDQAGRHRAVERELHCGLDFISKKLQEEVIKKYDFEKTIIGNSQAIRNLYTLVAAGAF